MQIDDNTTGVSSGGLSALLPGRQRKRGCLPCGFCPWFCKVVFLEGNREDDDVILFGIVVGLMENEYGYISLNELSDVELDLSAQGLGKLQVRQQQNFQPVPLKQIQDSRLQGFLAKFE